LIEDSVENESESEEEPGKGEGKEKKVPKGERRLRRSLPLRRPRTLPRHHPK
jgi:hypothetical protein